MPVLPLTAHPTALRLPSSLKAHLGDEWAASSAALEAHWNGDSRAPSPGQLAGATALQAALACWLDAQVRAEPAIGGLDLLAILDAAQGANPALPWLGEALGHPEPPDAAWSTPAATVLGSLFDGLLRPLRAGQTLSEQLSWVVDHWGALLDEDTLAAARVAADVIAEETTFRGFGGPGPTEAPGLGQLVGEPGYASEPDWMKAAVLAVRHGPVWLAQLTLWTGAEVRRLDQIPRSALAEIARHGATALWLVGIWERSEASRTIKRRRGNAEAAASAYSLVDYVVAADLGGEAALDVLRERAASVGLRLCADVVPNHTGLDSRWVVEHPEWFVQTDRPPFPGYTFDGPDLSGDPRISVRIEDGYWRGTDAAVVFQRVDNQTGEVRWLYHGNDGTTMPWNDTAQLDLTLPEVRKALIDTVLRLAQRFDLLRFDAAMALARQHVRRLWYPDAGEGGAIPSRAGRGLSEDEWARRMPGEFWSELVDAVRTQAPDTLLLAEAFWLMEVDFARSFGVNRVYWSAFRDWVRDGEHAQHRAWLTDALGREPQLLPHLCLFLSNPDEESVATAFGTGARYLAAATLQATLPGLPLLAHGQVGGLPERYGMEFVRPHLADRPDAELVARHQRTIAPLLRNRALFGSVDGFRLYDAIAPQGWVEQPIYAYSNRRGDQEALVVVNASPEHRWAVIHRSVPTKTDQGVVAETLTHALRIAPVPGRIVAMRDHRSGLWFLYRASDLATDGLSLSLEPWACRVFLEIVQLADKEGVWGALCDRLAGRGVPDLEAALKAPEPRRAGVLLHPTSLPGRERLGTLGDEAHGFVDWLARAGFTAWQLLPLNPAGPGESPYSSPASRLGNPLLVDLADLQRRRWVSSRELKQCQVRPRQRVRFDKARRQKLPILDRAAARLVAASDHPEHGEWLAWREAHPWADDDVLFGVLKGLQGHRPWWEWPADWRRPTPEVRESLRAEHADAVARGTVVAFWFDRQWAALREAAEAAGITLIGDLPFYVALDSADVWTAPEQFELDPEGRPLRLSAVPPDAFSEDGQLWGNPLYRWDVHRSEGFAWWIARFRRAREWTPVLRVDHFRGFAAYYAVQACATHARDGVWESGPGQALFDAVTDALGSELTIAEDLGRIDAEVHALRESTGMLATRVLQFGVGGDPTEVHHPAAVPEDAAVYTGTHDNDTTRSWFQALLPDDKAHVAEQLGVEPHQKAVVDGMIEAALRSPARLAILPMQDLLCLGKGGRMNRPGTGFGNWSWRLRRLPSGDGADRWRDRIAASGRYLEPTPTGTS